MTNCQRCGHPTRMKVSLYLDIPSNLAYQLSKRNLRSREVRVEAAGWPTATYYCEKCGWMLNLGR